MGFQIAFKLNACYKSILLNSLKIKEVIHYELIVPTDSTIYLHKLHMRNQEMAQTQ